MSAFREIWKKAIEANHELALNKAKGESLFRKLLESFPNDGMVYYERAESYEYLRLLDLSESDYATAERFSPVRHWKEVAQKGVIRIQRKRQSLPDDSPDTLWGIFHRIHALPYLPHEVRVDALSAIARFDSEPHIASSQLRSCRESITIAVFEKAYIRHADAKDLERKIALLDSLEIVPASISLDMDRVRDLGNKGTHPEKRRKGVNFSPSAVAFIRVAEWTNGFLQMK
jgi:tetratricopeptide (TPR) repeat protein